MKLSGLLAAGVVLLLLPPVSSAGRLKKTGKSCKSAPCCCTLHTSLGLLLPPLSWTVFAADVQAMRQDWGACRALQTVYRGANSTYAEECAICTTRIVFRQGIRPRDVMKGVRSLGRMRKQMTLLLNRSLRSVCEVAAMLPFPMEGSQLCGWLTCKEL